MIPSTHSRYDEALLVASRFYLYQVPDDFSGQQVIDALIDLYDNEISLPEEMEVAGKYKDNDVVDLIKNLADTLIKFHLEEPITPL